MHKRNENFSKFDLNCYAFHIKIKFSECFFYENETLKLQVRSIKKFFERFKTPK
jgi:hypothetical protein